MPETEMSRVLTVQNKMGIHARPAAMIVRISNKYANCEVWVEKDGEQVNGKSIMSLMMLAAGKGSEVKFIASGNRGSFQPQVRRRIIFSGNGYFLRHCPRISRGFFCAPTLCLQRQKARSAAPRVCKFRVAV